jgi:hypothetical protein
VKSRRPRPRVRALPFGTVVYLPSGVSLGDVLWEPAPDEIELQVNERRRRNRLAKLHKLEIQWAREDTERLRRRAAELEVVVKQDRAWLEREEAWEKEIQRRKDIISQLHAKEAAEERKRLLAKLARVTEEMNRSTVRAEREVLARRGVLRGMAR